MVLSKLLFLKQNQIWNRVVVPLDEMKLFERRTGPKKSLNEVLSTSLRTVISSTGSKSNKEVTLKTREAYFMYRKPQKLKNCKTKSETVFEKTFRKISRLCQSHNAEKARSSQLLLQNAVFPVDKRGRAFIFGKKSTTSGIGPKKF